jgi:competence protein ComGC
MDTAAEALLIIVSSVLSVFLIVSIIALVYFISVLKQLKRITEKAENAADSVESAAQNLGKITSAAAIFRLFNNIISHSKTSSRKD